VSTARRIDPISDAWSRLNWNHATPTLPPSLLPSNYSAYGVSKTLQAYRAVRRLKRARRAAQAGRI